MSKGAKGDCCSSEGGEAGFWVVIDRFDQAKLDLINRL